MGLECSDLCLHGVKLHGCGGVGKRGWWGSPSPQWGDPLLILLATCPCLSSCNSVLHSLRARQANKKFAVGRQRTIQDMNLCLDWRKLFNCFHFSLQGAEAGHNTVQGLPLVCCKRVPCKLDPCFLHQVPKIGLQGWYQIMLKVPGSCNGGGGSDSILPP